MHKGYKNAIIAAKVVIIFAITISTYYLTYKFFEKGGSSDKSLETLPTSTNSLIYLLPLK